MKQESGTDEEKSQPFYAPLVDSDAGSDRDAMIETELIKPDDGTSKSKRSVAFDDDVFDKEESNKFSYVSESKSLLKNMFLMSLQIIFEFGASVLATVMVGHYYDNPHDKTPNASQSDDDEYISAIGLATTYSFVIAQACVWGVTTPLFTLAPQAIGAGEQRKHRSRSSEDIMAGDDGDDDRAAADDDPTGLDETVKNALTIYLHRCFALVFIVSIPTSILQFFSGNIMVAIGEPEYLETRITSYCVSLIPWYIGNAVFTGIQRTCQALDMNWMLFITTGIGFFSSIPIMYILMYTCDMGYLGTGWAQAIGYWIVIASTVGILYKRGFGFLFAFGKFNFYSIIMNKEDLIFYLKLSVPQLLQYWFSWWVIEIAMILSGYIGRNDSKDNSPETVSISTTVIMYNLYVIYMSFAMGLASSINIRVGKYIGRNQIENAKLSAKLGFAWTCILCLVFGMSTLLCRDYIMLAFTHNHAIRKLGSDVLYTFVIFMIFYVFANAFNGLYRGLGSPDKSSLIILVGYYVVSIPFMFICLFGFG